MTTTHTPDLYDYHTGELIGPATTEQHEASNNAGDFGLILVDRDGNVVAEGSWAAQQPGTRVVYTR